MTHPLHWSPEEKNAARTQGILEAVKDNGEKISETNEHLQSINQPVLEKLEEMDTTALEGNHILREIEGKEFPTKMAVSIEGIEVITLKGDKGDQGRSPLVVSESEPENPQIGDLWYKP